VVSCPVEDLPDYETALYWDAYCSGLRPDPPLWVDQWSEAHMRIPEGAESGAYRVERTPFAREIMQALSPADPTRRVVARIASQLTKTQVALNWVSAMIDGAPANILVLLLTLGLAKRVSSRISKTIQAIPALREKVAAPRSRDARNTLDTKEFAGGTLYITTAGSAANLAEVPVRYFYGDEIDRWDLNVDGEGDPIELARKRMSTYGRRSKEYLTSSPTIEGISRIDALYRASDQRHYYVPCPHCGSMQALEWDRMRWAPDYSWVQYACKDCEALIEESNKSKMLRGGEWRAHAQGDGQTAGFWLSALYAPLGWVSWPDLAKEYDAAKSALNHGDSALMQVYYNTRLAIVWNDAEERVAPKVLQARAEDYRLRTVPAGGLVLTAAVDVQGNRLELQTEAWGEELEHWVVDYHIISGSPSDPGTWEALDEVLLQPLRHASGRMLQIRAAMVDSGGHNTQDVYDYCRHRRQRGIIPVKGANRPGRPVIAARPSHVDVRSSGRVIRAGVELWMVGADTAKDWVYNRFRLASGPGAQHFSTDLPDEYYQQLTAERKLARYIKGHKRIEWIKANRDRNEALDLTVYNLAAAHFLGLHRYRKADWQRLRVSLAPPDQDQHEESQSDRATEKKGKAEKGRFIQQSGGGWFNR